MLKVVLDTNVFVSAFLTEGIGARIIKKWQKGDFVLLISKEILQEISKVLNTLEVPEAHIIRLIKIVHKKAKMVKPNFKVEICRDPDDNKFIECAIKGKADIIVSRDKDLLVIGKI